MAVAIFEFIDDAPVADPPPFVIFAHRDDAPLGIESTWLVWSERGPFRLEKVTAKSFYEARKLGAAKLGMRVEHVDASREVRLEPRFGERA